MMENIAIISELIKHGKKGTHDLYGKIPFFLRKRLDGAISCQPWAAVSEGCERNDPDSLERANSMYQMILDTADEYIRRCSNSKPETDNSTLMMVDRNNIQREFQNDAAKFASEMAKCLEREKELIFTYQASDLAEFDRSLHSEDIADRRDNDDDLKIIEQLTQETSNRLSEAIKMIENKNRYTAIFEAIYQGHDLREIGPDTDNIEEIRHYTNELESIGMNESELMEQLLLCKQNAIEYLKETCHRCKIYVENLMKELDAWKAAEAKRSVKVGPETDTSFLLNRSKRFGDVINTIQTWFSKEGSLQVIRMEEQNNSPSQMGFSLEAGKLENEFQNVLSNLFQVIVTVQPKGVISIENKGKKDSPNYCTKKTQPFTTTVRILAGECFQSFHITSKQVELVAEKDLAQGSSAPVTGRDGRSCLKVESSTGNTLPDIQFNIEVRNFCRLEQNNVYKQFFRLCYKVTVSVNGTVYNLQTLSLPFTFNTGANQILEHMGARMWYCASVPDLYKYGFQCPDPLSADDLISILDNRVAHLGEKTRRLTEAEKLFLKSRLPVASDGTVTMQGFVKVSDKMKALRSNEPLSFSFYTWFYAVIHSIELLLSEAWQDGIIYGLCSEKTAEEILMDRNVPEGTFLLRPSISEIKKTSSVDATAAFVMEVKRRNEDAHPFDGHDSEFVVTSVPLFYKHIEKNTLYGAIKGIEFNGRPVAKFLYGRDGGRTLDILKGYVKKPKERFLPEYRVLMEKIEKFSIRQGSGKSPAGEDIPEGDDDSGRESGPRKRRYRKPSSNVQGQSTSWSQPSALLDESSSGSGVLPVFNVLSSGEIKQENSLQFQSNAATNMQCQRSATQGKKMPDSFDGTACNGNSAHNTDGFNSTEVVYGDVTVDTSHISNVAVSSSPPYCQSGQVSPQSQVTGYGSADYAIGNLEYANASIQQYNTQYKINGINNNHLSDSSNSPASNFNYPSPLISSPPQDNYSFRGLHSTMPVMENLPTTINDARESKKSPRRQGKSRGNNGSASRKKAPASSRSVVAPLEINMNQVILLDDKGIQHQNHSIHNDSGFNPNLPFVQFGISSDTSMEFIGSEQLAASINEQRNNLQLSPDSGVGDQSPSPISSYINHHLLSSINSRAVIGQELLYEF